MTTEGMIAIAIAIVGWISTVILMTMSASKTWGKVSQIIDVHDARIVVLEAATHHNEACVHRIELDTREHRATVLERLNNLTEGVSLVRTNIHHLRDDLAAVVLNNRLTAKPWDGQNRRKGD